MKLELQIFICFAITFGYVMYGDLYKSKEQTLTAVKQQTVGGFEIRIINDHANERLEVTSTLGQALAYIEKYSMHHDDLIVFDLSTGAKVDHRYEVRIGFSDYTYSNGTWKNTIYTSLSLKESEKYLNEHKAVHTDLVIYDLATGDKVASSEGGVGVTHASIID